MLDHEIRTPGKLDGYEDTPRQAARRVEDSWFEAVRGTSLDVALPAPSGNAYAAAKGKE